jgi:glycerophosphoryl diester phosphodiesterase
MLVFGHRGASAYAPMNTLPAFELAAEQGADGIELDVHRSADGHPVIVHDFTVDKTTNGTGRVTGMTLAQLRTLDAGAWFNEAFRGTQVPTLDEVVEAVGQRLFVNVEIKANSWRTDGVEQVVADCIARHRMQRRVIVSSFNPPTLRRFRALAPDVPIAFLYARETPFFAHWMLSGVRVDAVHPHHVQIDARLMQRAASRGQKVNTWTVNDPGRARELRALGVNVVITDKPDVIKAAVES